MSMHNQLVQLHEQSWSLHLKIRYQVNLIGFRTPSVRRERLHNLYARSLRRVSRRSDRRWLSNIVTGDL